jgi:hypothetical protein
LHFFHPNIPYDRIQIPDAGNQIAWIIHSRNQIPEDREQKSENRSQKSDIPASNRPAQRVRLYALFPLPLYAQSSLLSPDECLSFAIRHSIFDILFFRIPHSTFRPQFPLPFAIFRTSQPTTHNPQPTTRNSQLP